RRQPKKNNTSTILLVVAGVLVLIGAILIGRWAISGGGGVGNDTVAAPNFVGETRADAEKLAVNGDLKLTFKEEPCENQSKGKICDQDPDAGTKVEKDSTVTLTVSTGAPKVAVPDVQGLTYEKAKSQLEEKGFVVEQETEVSDQTPGVVIGQDPEGDTDQEKGSTITLTVAKEADKATVPDVTNRTCDEAKTQMTANELVGNCVQVETDNPALVDKVIGTDPVQGTQLAKNSPVTIQIGKAKENQTFAMPKVTQMTVGQAKQVLAGAGLQLERVQGGGDDNAVVLQSTPQEGQQVKKGDKVTLIAFGGQQGDNGGNNGGIFGGLTGGREDD
ncbi:serine/threonine protein kinase, partial [Streptomyces sp. 13-12-16]|uniref:Stk1 family PASTA domain-containing Ser/Thr kinase n=2 Tax=unclassified Streptomyces TaxID=2593676 RepID=UPI000A24A5AE